MNSDEYRYTVARADRQVPLTGDPTAAPWPAAQVAPIDVFPWFRFGARQETRVRLLYDEQALYAQYNCQDAHSYAETTQLNGPVWRDSCVELFACPDPARSDYFNFEMNCCGTFLLFFNMPGAEPSRKVITPELAGRVRVAASLPGPIKAESPTDENWWAAARLPFDVIAELSGQPVRVGPGTKWRANFYRCGGRVDPQHGCWSPIDATANLRPCYHLPEYFGTLAFE